MAYELNPYAVKVTLVAAADLDTFQYRFVQIDSNGKAAAITAVGQKPFGVLQNAPLSGQEAEVLILGVSKIRTETASLSPAAIIAAGAGTTPKGQAITAVSGTDYAAGTVLTAGSAAGDVITAVIDCTRPIKASW